MSEATSVIKQMGGVEVSKLKAPFLHSKVERLAMRAGINKPRIFVIPDSTPNACAVGLSREDSAVAVHTGLLNELDENEIESVLAHEIGHIQKGHSIEKTEIAMRAMAIGIFSDIGARAIATSDMDLTPGDNDSDDTISTLMKFGIGIAVTAAGTSIAENLMTTSSFRTEFEADECGAQFSKKPWALVSALRKIEDFSKVGANSFAPEVSQLFIISPSYLNHQTHPETSERIRKLSGMSGMLPKVDSVATIFCPSCGEKTDEDGRFCYWCGGGISPTK